MDAEYSLHILIIEDSEGDYLLIENYIRESFDTSKLVHTGRLSEAESKLQQFSFDLIFLDLSLPDSVGKDSILQILSLAKETPVIVLTGNSDLNFAIESMQLGVQDYLNKDDITATSIQKSIRYSIERNKIKLQLINSDNRFRSIIEHSIDGFALINVDGLIHELSPYGNSILGYDPIDLAGNFRLDLLHPRDRRLVITTFKEVLKIPGSVNLLEFRYKNKSGKYIWIESTFYNLLENPAVKAIVLNYREVTPRKEAEEKRKLLIQELTLNNKYLKQFGLIVSHNLRGPLTNLLSISDLINNELLTDLQIKELKQAFRVSTLILNDTLNDIIKILLIREKRQIPLERIELLGFWNDFFAKRSHMENLRTLDIKTDFENAATVFFDRDFLDSIFSNLLSNSIKFAAPTRKLQIKMETYYSGNDIVLTFSDNGIGFNTDMVKERLFGLYQKFHDTQDGKGFGLYLIHSLIGSLGGTISCNSIRDKGTTFEITFKNQH